VELLRAESAAGGASCSLSSEDFFGGVFSGSGALRMFGNRFGKVALSKGRANIAFTCFHLLGDHEQCINVLIATKKIPEATFYARTYAHDKVNDLVNKWKLTVAGLPRIRDAIADPATLPNLFPNMRKAPEPEPTPPKKSSEDREHEAPPAADSARRSSTGKEASPPHDEGQGKEASPPHEEEHKPEHSEAHVDPHKAPKESTLESLENDEVPPSPAVDPSAASIASAHGSPAPVKDDLDDIFDDA